MNVALRPETVCTISLCTGGGGLDLGLELAVPSARSVCYVEREAFACAHLVSAFEQGLVAEAPLWSDVGTFNGRPWRGLVDGVIGGIPCQPHSLAGKRLGEDDERDLWSDARRIIVQSGAWFVLIENVSGMLSSGGAERVWRDLHRLGFQVEGGLFTASEVGASHERERLFILAVADSHGRFCSGRSEFGSAPFGRRAYDEPARSGSGFRRDMADAMRDRAAAGAGAPARDEDKGGKGRRKRAKSDDGGCAVADASGAGLQGRERIGASQERDGQAAYGPVAEFRGASLADTASDRGRESRKISKQIWQSFHALPDIDRPSAFPPGPGDLSGWRDILTAAPELEPAFRRVADGLASRLDVARVDRLRMLGNGVVPLQAAYAIRTLAARLAARGSAGAARLVRLMVGGGEI
jgi:DNA (cytosine-5)-methyltransferase 1